MEIEMNWDSKRMGKIILFLYGVLSGTTEVNSKCRKLSHQETLNLDATVHG